MIYLKIWHRLGKHPACTKKSSTPNGVLGMACGDYKTKWLVRPQCGFERLGKRKMYVVGWPYT